MFRKIFKTIFIKLIIVFIGILLLSFSITAVMLNYFLSNFLSSEKYKLLSESGQVISDFISEYSDSIDNNPLAQYYLRNAIRGAEINTKSKVWIVNKEGYIVYTNSQRISNSINSINRDVLGKLNQDVSGNYRLPEKSQYKRVMLGEDETVKEIGDFYGLFRGTGVTWLTIEKPIKVTYSSGKVETIGAVYLHTTISEVQRAKKAVLKFFLIAVGVSIFISIILVYIFSLRISRPLKQIKNAAKEIAGGEFQKRLDIKAKDEIGELAVTFNNMAVALQNLEEMRRGFIANVSHELRTPMTSIRGFIEGILDGTIPPDRQHYYLNIVREETIRLSRLVSDLLDLARMESGEISLSYKSFNINELIRRCIIKLENLITDKNIQIEADFELEDMQVFADKDAIERVIINLIHNAIKFTNENGLITINVKYYEDKVLFTIKDSGIGIEKEELDLIWDRFYKSDKSRGKDKTGTGLGLAIIKSIINEHKQEIWVESEIDEGTSFMFTLERAHVN